MSTLTFEERFLSGRELYADNFDDEDIARWFADEEHGYAELYGSDISRHAYGYTALNLGHGFSALPRARRFTHALGFGSNFGDELLPVLDRLDRITLLDASDRYVVAELRGVPVNYVMAQPSGRIALPDASVDLITCFGVLHHIPNVSRVVREFARVLMPGGVLLVREPTTSMGDWRRPRVGLTPRERGIPKALFEQMVREAGLHIERTSDCYFPPWVRLCGKLRIPTFLSRAATAVDAVFSRAFRWNSRYHRKSLASRFAPASAFIVAHRIEPRP